MTGARHQVFDDVPGSGFNIEWSLNEINGKLSSINEQRSHKTVDVDTIYV